MKRESVAFYREPDTPGRAPVAEQIAQQAESAGVPASGARRKPMRRRHAMARWLAAGVGLSLMSRATARTAEAADGQPIAVGGTFDGTTPTRLRTNNTTGSDTTADGLQGYAAGANNAGLFGRNDSTGGIGVSGAAPSGTGVFGESSNGWGVAGKSSSGRGVQGESTSAHGVYGVSNSSIGVRGISTSSAAVYGTTYSSNSYGVLGESTSTGTAVCGSATGGGLAGAFSGPVHISGNFTVVNGSKSAAVPHPDGSLRRLYCQESPESYFEDFGQGQLANGRAQVRLDPDFAAVVRTDDYAAFPIPEGDCRGLYVTAKSPTGFEVRELQGGTANISFRFRIVARRRDIPGPRFERVIPPPLLIPPPTPGEPGYGLPPTATPTPVATSGLPASTPTPQLTPTATPPASATPGVTSTPTSLPSATTGTTPAATATPPQTSTPPASATPQTTPTSTPTTPPTPTVVATSPPTATPTRTPPPGP